MGRGLKKSIDIHVLDLCRIDLDANSMSQGIRNQLAISGPSVKVDEVACKGEVL